ncbi:hypothetical protein BGM09_16095 [Streptomyces sp. CBMA29]|nr:hypothetical protein [Streptomyces sp. CBMA29]
MVEGAPEEVDGIALEAESDVGVNAGGDTDVGMPEEFLDDDEVDALFQEQSARRASEVVETDGPELRALEESAESAGEIGGVERSTGGGGEDEPVVRPTRSGWLALFLLSFLVDLEGVDAFGGEGDAAFGGAGLGVQDVGPWLRVRWRERWMVAVPLSRPRSSRCSPRSSPLRSPVRRASSYRAWSRSLLAERRNCRASFAVKGLKRRGWGVGVFMLRATLRGGSSSRTACSRADLRTEWM